jgi:hypothetical protein
MSVAVVTANTEGPRSGKDPFVDISDSVGGRPICPRAAVLRHPSTEWGIEKMSVSESPHVQFSHSMIPTLSCPYKVMSQVECSWEKHKKDKMR